MAENPSKASGDAKKGEKGSEAEAKVSMLRLLQYATPYDWLLFWLGTLGAAIHGASWPVWTIFFGQSINKFQDESSLTDQVRILAIEFTVLGFIGGVGAFLRVNCFTRLGQRQGTHLRVAFFRAVLQQDISWHDEHPSGGIMSQLSESVQQVQDALGDKLGQVFLSFSQGLAGLIISFVFGWKLAFVVLAITPLLGASAALLVKVQQQSRDEESAASTAGSIVDEVLTLIRTVMAFGTYKQEAARYDAALQPGRVAAKKAGRSIALAHDLPHSTMFLIYAVAFYFGSWLVRNGELAVGDIMIVLVSTITAGMGFGGAAPFVTEIGKARAAAVGLFEVLDRKPPIDALSTAGECPRTLTGNIEFRDIEFAYPTRPDVKVLRGLSVSVASGETLALVGHSGCGKSTVVGLLERFQDPTSGAVLLDGRDIRTLNVQWLRHHIGFVTQMPALFTGTVFENIALGKEGATREEVEAAARAANAHEFITSFADGYDTIVGESGTGLSGGQRQRIAIARALIKNPPILLLDEATSALDTHSETVVQDALNRAAEGRTSIVIAHRLSTIRNANKIAYVEAGQIVEIGTHEELMALGGKYMTLVQAQGDASLQAAAGAGSRRESHAIAPASGPRKSTFVFGKESAAQIAVDSKDGKEDEDLLAEDDPEPDLRDQPTESLLWWGLKFNRPERGIIIATIVSATLSACVWPVFSVLLSRVLTIVLDPNHSEEVIRWWCIGFLGMSLINMMLGFVRLRGAAYAGEQATYRIRKMLFWRIINQPAAWFDDPRHRKALLSLRLSTDAGRVRLMLAESLANQILVLGTVAFGIIVALVFCWRVTLVILACIPIVFMGMVIQRKIVFEIAAKMREELQVSSLLAQEVIAQIRVSTSLGRIAYFEDRYRRAAMRPANNLVVRTFQAALVLGFSTLFTFAMWSIAFYYGSVTVKEDQCTFEGMIRAIMEVLFCAIMAGVFAAAGPNSAQGRVAALRVYAMIKDTQDPDARGAAGDKRAITGAVEFRNVTFSYPTRPTALVLRNLNLTIHPGETLALVGPSGGGKSTIVLLLQQLYSALSGEILLDGTDLSTLNPDATRAQMAVVQQDANLFSTTIAENIAYGIKASPEEIEAAAREANAHQFISEFPEGYNTKVGQSGVQLSGGQRQRISIARALLRHATTKILLLDEATSAVDVQNERLVQQAFDRARKGRTTIIIAHRLSTIQGADRIAVIRDGSIAELGTHDELLHRRGVYYRLVTRNTEDVDGADHSVWMAAGESQEPSRAPSPATVPVVAGATTVGGDGLTTVNVPVSVRWVLDI